jgi:hypothetical protein
MLCGRVFTGLYGTAELEISREVRETVKVIDGDRPARRGWLRPVTDPWRGGSSDESAVGEAVSRRSALDAQAVLRKVRADRERRNEDLAVEVLIAVGERDGAVQDAVLRAGEALRAMTVDEGRSIREAADWCGGGVTVRDVSRLRRLAQNSQGVAGR